VSGNTCPRCGNGKLFSGFLTLKPACESCALSYAFADSDDGAAVFIILGAGALVVAAALWTEITYTPPLWVHFAIFMPMAAVVCLSLLRPLKAFTVHRQYLTRAAEGRIER
jgi:uncharacterized protein (DUF983 family)